MSGFRFSGISSRMSGIAAGPVLAAVFVTALTAPAGAAPGKVSRSAPPAAAALPTPAYPSGEDTEVPEGATECTAEKGTRRSAVKATCTRLPKKIVPWSLRAGKQSPLSLGNGSGAIALVTNEAGDELEVSVALPSTPYKPPFKKDCALVIPYLGGAFNPCGYVTFYDAKWKTSEKAPDTNKEEDAQYDACGKLASSGKTSGWHVVGTKYTLYGWHAGHEAEIPASEPTPCLGVWTLIYSWTQTFSDNETLTESVEVPFLVTAVPISASATWGGGNPSELPCSQACHGDPVNTATGDYYETTTDLAIPGRGPGLRMTRTYSSLAARAGISSPLGRGWAFSYDLSLSVDPESGDATVTNANGSQTQFEASPKGFVAEPRVLAALVENEDGTYTYTVKGRTIYTFDSSGKLTGISDLNGNETALSYDESGQLQSAEDGTGRSFTFGYEKESGLLTSVTDSTKRSVSYAYTGSGDLEDVIDVRGGHTEFTYDKGGLLLTRTDARENIVLTNTYDTGGRVLTQTNGLENTSTFSYSGTEPFTATSVTNPRGYVTKYEYEFGALVKRVEASNTGTKATWIYEHDPVTLGITAVTDPNGHTTHATYDSRGNQTSTEDALGHTTESVYDSLNDLTEYTDANEVTTTYTYDESGNLLSSSTPLVGSKPTKARAVTYTYGSKAHPGDVTAITDPNGKTTSFTYDAVGDVTSSTDAAGDETTYTYDERGHRLTEVSPRGNAKGGEPAEYTKTFTYDAAGNRLSATDPLEHEREWTYDPNGNLETETDANGHTTTYGHDAANRPVSVERPEGQVEQTTYDKNGNVESRLDGLENETTYSYDPLDHVEASTDPLGRTTSYRYYQGGNLKLVIDPQERATFFGYNVADELTEVEYEDETTPNVEFDYDANGRRTSMIDGTGESTYEYDSLGRLTDVTNGHGDATSYGYDLAGNVTSIVYPNGKTLTRTFDDAGRLESVGDWLGNTTSFAYDANSNLESTTFPEGTDNVDEYIYDRADRMSAVEMLQGIETLASLGYSRDKVGQLESLTAEGLPGEESEAFEYDEDDRLIKAGSESFEYDDANNLTKAPGTTNTYDVANELEAGTEVAYRYDKLGERTEAGSPTATYLSFFGSSGTGNGQFAHPAGIATDAEGDLWVVDEENNRVEEFSPAGEYLSSFGSTGSENGEFERPTDVAIDAEGRLWVTDAGNNRVEEFDEEGKYLSQFGSSGSGNGEFSEPESVAVDSQGNIWVADTYNGRLQEFDEEGEFIKVVGEYGEEEGQILEATGIAVDPDDNVWVADWGNNRVEEFDEEGEFIRQFGTFGSGKGQFEGSDAIDVDAEGDVWVGDEGNERIQVFNPSGEYLGQFGSYGSGKGQFSFTYPMGIAADSQGNIWVADSENNRVQKWQVSDLEPPTTYDYDQAGNLIAVERPETGEAPAIDESYTYDGAGLRVSQTVSETTSHLTWNQSGGLPLLLSDGQASYIYGPDGLPVEQISSTGTPTYYHHDQLGSTRMLTDTSGEATGTFSYGAYGKLVGSTGTATTPLGYAGQYTNTESGLQYLRARVYDPVTGQFLTRDPLTAMTHSPYNYASDNPLNSIDPSGLCNANPFSESFWTESNCISESDFNPLKYYEEEIEAIENGCSYWEAVTHGLKGAAVLTIDAAGLFAAVAAAPAAFGTVGALVKEFALRYPDAYLFLLNRAAKIGTGPPVASTAATFFWGWMEEHLRP